VVQVDEGTTYQSQEKVLQHWAIICQTGV